MVDTSPITSAAPKMGWVKTKEADKRPPLPEIATEAANEFEPKGWPKQQFEDVKKYALDDGNPKISKQLAKMTDEQRQIYIDTGKEVFLQHCDPKNWRDGNPVRPPIIEIVDAAAVKFKEKGWKTTQLDNIKKYVEQKGNRTIGAHLSKLNPEQTKAYFGTVTRVFARACGYEWQEIKEEKAEEAPEPVAMMSVATPETVTIGEVNPYWAEPGKEFKLTVTGDNLKQIASAEGPEPFDSLGQPQVSADGKELKFDALTVPADAKAGKYQIVLKDASGKAVASFEVAVSELGERRFSDTVRKLKIKADVNTGLVAGAKGYAALGIYEEPITVNNIGANAGLAPQIIGEDGYKKSEKHELNLKLDADIAYRGYKDDSSMMGARLGADYRYAVHPKFAPEVYASGSVRKTSYKNPTPQYFSGTTLAGSAGLAVNSQLSAWAAARAHFGVIASQSQIDERYLGYSEFTSFTDNARSLETGLKVQLGKGLESLNGEFHVNYRQGYHEVPDRMQIAGVWYDNGPTYETINILNAGARAALGGKLRLAYDYTAKRYQGWFDNVDIHHINVGTSLKGSDLDFNVDLRPKSNFKSFGPSWQNQYAGLGVSVVSLNGNAGVAVGGSLNLYNIAEKIWGTRRPVYAATQEFQPEPAAPMPDVAEKEIKDPLVDNAPTTPAAEPAPGTDPNGIE